MKNEEIIDDQAREIFELNKIIAGAKSKEELLLDYIDNMCGMIEMQVNPKEHDRWLADVIHMGWYSGDE